MQGGMRKISAFRENSRIVKYSKCSKGAHPDDDLDDVTVINNAAPENVKYGTAGCITANGPRVVPGIITSSGGEITGMVSNERRNMPTATGAPHTAGPSTPSGSNDKASESRQSLIDTVTKRVTSSEPYAFVNKAHIGSEIEIPRKTRELRRKEIKKDLEKWETSTSSSERPNCKWTFVFDPSGRLCFYWSVVVSLAFLYNFWCIIYRFAFQEITMETLPAWFTLDYLADFIYILDIGVHFRTGYLEEGVLQTDSMKLRQHYMNSTMVYIDCMCLLPFDFLYLSIGFNSILRSFRLVKIYRFWACLDRTERHTNFPNVFRAISLTHYVLVIFHWNACLFHIISVNGGFGSKDWFPKVEKSDDVLIEYLHGFYWSTLALAHIGGLPHPRTRGEYIFLLVQLLGGLFLFATVLGHVANIVTNISLPRKEFQAKLDSVKTYMRMRKVPGQLFNKVIKWFDYLWFTQKSSDEERSVGCLPDKLKAEIAIHVHLDTLKRVEIFQNTEQGFLRELVLRLRPVLFSPGDFICRKGEVGKEMYIVNRGRLQVVTDNGKTVLATLKAGSYFGEISVLNMGTAGNRRTASVKSVGYSDLFCLYKQDMWDVLKDYPAARVRLEAIAVKRLEKYKKEEDVKKYDPKISFLTSRLTVPASVAMARSRSTPGLVESRGKVPLEEMPIPDDEIQPVSSSIGDPDSSGSAGKSAPRCHFHPSSYLSPPVTYTVQGASSIHSCASDSTHADLLRPSSRTNIHLIPSSPIRTRSPMPIMSDYTYNLDQQSWFAPPPFPMPYSAHYPARETLMAEVSRLREKLVNLEDDNTKMRMQLSQQQWDFENRLTGLELQLCTTTGGTTPTSMPSLDRDENEESVI